MPQKQRSLCEAKEGVVKTVIHAVIDFVNYLMAWCLVLRYLATGQKWDSSDYEADQ
jgi:hypothetical protein